MYKFRNEFLSNVKRNGFIRIYLYITYYVPLERGWSHGHRFTANTERTPCHGVKATEWRFHPIRKDIDTLRSYSVNIPNVNYYSSSRSTNNTITEFGRWNYFRSWLCVLDFRSYERVSVAPLSIILSLRCNQINCTYTRLRIHSLNETKKKKKKKFIKFIIIGGILGNITINV